MAAPEPKDRERAALGPRSVLQDAWLIAAKDLRIEARTREILVTAGFFAVLVTLMTSVAFSAGAETRTRIAPGVIWIAVTFSAVLALGRTWHREREESALLGVLVTPISRGALFLGKAAGIFAFVVAVEILVVPVAALLFHVELAEVAGPLAILLLLGTIGIASLGTLFGVMTVRTQARDLVLAAVLFPLLTPTLLSGVAATREVFTGAGLADVSDYLVLLGVFDVLGVLGGLALFGALVDD